MTEKNLDEYTLQIYFKGKKPWEKMLQKSQKTFCDFSATT